MTPYVSVLCSTCQKEFKAKIYRKVVHIFPMVYKMYLRCPHCKTVYVSGYFDAEVQRRIDLGASRESILEYQKELENRYDPAVHS